MRGNSELKQEAAVIKANAIDEDAEEAGEGLDWDYAMLWSNNSTDMLATFIPGAAGGSSGQEVDQDYESCEVLWQWSERPFAFRSIGVAGESTSGPVYYGAIVAFSHDT